MSKICLIAITLGKNKGFKSDPRTQPLLSTMKTYEIKFFTPLSVVRIQLGK